MKFSKLTFDVIKRIIDTKVNTAYYTDLKDWINKSDDKVQAALLPNVIIFNPFDSNTNIYCPLCKEDKFGIFYLDATGQFEHGSSSGRYPRLIWDCFWYCALVGQICTCKNGHSVASYHSGILNQLKTSDEDINFILSHKSGMTNSLFNVIIRLVEHGNNFNAVESIFATSFMDKAYEKLCAYGINDNKAVIEDLKRFFPTHELISWCFIFNYFAYKATYTSEMEKIPFQWLSGDHTFKVAANIGYMKDGKWIKMYDSLFCLMNEKGQVKGFKLLKGTSFDSVIDLFHSVGNQNSYPEFVIIDNCCHWKNKLQQVFPDTEVKLDLFHAISRLTSQISQSHPLKFDAIRELGNVFRQVNDFGPNRKSPTPSPEMLISNIDNFLQNWNDVNYCGWKVLQDNFFTEVEKLKKHIISGCLSNIPPGAGTNRNENLHKQLSSLVSSGKLGVKTAESIFNHLFYIHNAKKSGEKFVHPISIKGICNGFPNKPPLIRNTPSASLMVEEIDQDQNAMIDHSYSQGNIDKHTRAVVFLASILEKINATLPREVTSRLYQYQGYATLITEIWNPALFFSRCKDSLLYFEVSHVLESMSLREIPSPVQPSESLIYSLFYSLSSLESNDLPQEMRDVFTSPYDQARKSILEICKNEAVGERLPYYDGFFKGDLFDVVSSFSDALPSLQDILPIMISNAFGVTILIIPTCLGIPMIPIIPQFFSSQHVIFILFNTKSLVFSLLMNKETIPIQRNYCRCGSRIKKSKNSEQRCINPFKCSCRKKNLSCSSRCSCQHCGNNKDTKSTKSVRRKRLAQVLSQMPKETSLQYVLSSGQNPNENRIFGLQHFLLELCLFLILKDMQADFMGLSESLVVQRLAESYNKIKVDLVHVDVEGLKPIEMKKISEWVNWRKQKGEIIKQRQDKIL